MRKFKNIEVQRKTRYSSKNGHKDEWLNFYLEDSQKIREISIFSHYYQGQFHYTHYSLGLTTFTSLHSDNS